MLNSKVTFQEKCRVGPAFSVLKNAVYLVKCIESEDNFALILHFALCVPVVWKSYFMQHISKQWKDNENIWKFCHRFFLWLSLSVRVVKNNNCYCLCWREIRVAHSTFLWDILFAGMIISLKILVYSTIWFYLLSVKVTHIWI